MTVWERGGRYPGCLLHTHLLATHRGCPLCQLGVYPLREGKVIVWEEVPGVPVPVYEGGTRGAITCMWGRYPGCQYLCMREVPGVPLPVCGGGTRGASTCV